MKLAIVGTRDYQDYAFFRKQVALFLTDRRPELIISGGAPGIDALAERYAREENIPLQVFPADWKQYGKSAGPRRNTEIVAVATHVLALPSSSSVGTYDTIRKAERAGKPLHVVRLQ